jgi:GH25 family lysozyme M1 (1,4-beta-N-acetylmuramidase)
VSALVTLATTQTITGAKTFSAATTFGTLNATALQVGGVDISSTYATQTALGLKQDRLTAALRPACQC